MPLAPDGSTVLYSGPCGVSHLSLAVLAGHSYYDPRQTSQGPGVAFLEGVDHKVAYDKAFYFHPVGDVEAVAYLIGDIAILAWRGTEIRSLTDIVRDMRCWPAKTACGDRVHAGFYKGALNWMEHYWLLFSDNYSRRGKLILCGHSMGAALAVQVALLLSEGRMVVDEVALFAEPRGLFKPSQNRYRGVGLAEVTTSYREGNDLVTRSPFWGKNSVKPTLIGKSNFLRDHGIANYAKALL